ncbi:MAG: polymer-forming cytoskeletal protein [Oscillospiraceae bacterium]|nr:polymer-forming cytoskeletal protein [Oscillospiraceae bacterium]
MRSRKSSEITYETIIGNGIKLESGMLTGKEPVRIDGEYTGVINLSGHLLIGESGSVNGNIRAGSILIAGYVKGDVYCDSTVHMAATAHVEARVAAQTLKTDEGAHFNGQCMMLNAKTRNVFASQSDQEEMKAFDFAKLNDVFIPEDGPPVIPDLPDEL